MPGQKTWAVGEEVLAADFNSYVQSQVVPQFGSIAARDAQWVAPPRGAVCITTDTLTTWIYTGTAWAVAPMLGAERTIYEWRPSANTATVGTAETAVHTTPALEFVAGRVYYVELIGRAWPASGGVSSVTYYVRETSISGAMRNQLQAWFNGTNPFHYYARAPFAGFTPGTYPLVVSGTTNVGTSFFSVGSNAPAAFRVTERALNAGGFLLSADEIDEAPSTFAEGTTPLTDYAYVIEQ